MRQLSKAKWLTASGGFFCLASFLALSVNLPGKETARLSALTHSTKPLRAGSAPALRRSASDNANVLEHYGQLPLAFEPAASASNSEAKFLARGNGYALFLTNREAVLALHGKSMPTQVVGMELSGANPAPAFSALEELPGKSNYFIGNKPEAWRKNVPQYRKVLEKNVYPGVNLVYYGTQGRLEYDFDVAPGADPSVIQLAFRGTDDLRIDAQGELVINSAAGEVRMRKPVAYQDITGTRNPVAAAYVLKNKTTVAFQLAGYDSRSPLVIDPILIYSTYLGGSNIDIANSIAVAPDNTAFIAGYTFSLDFPTIHALQANDGGGPDFPLDAFVSKISADGSTLLYSSYLGGENQDAANGIAVDNFGDAFVTGYTLSPHFPVSTGSFDTLCGGDGKCGASFNDGFIVSNAFVTELNPAGSGIIYSTFFGYYENVKGQAIAVDANGNAYLTGSTTENFTPTVAIVPPKLPPPPFPITVGAFQQLYGGGSTNAFVSVIDATGKSVLYSSYLGGNIEDVGNGIAVDANATAYIAGLTYSTNFPTTAGALQAAAGGEGDAFASNVNTHGLGAASLVYSTYIGGIGLDQGNAIAIDPTGNAYVTGLTNSAGFGFAPTGFQKTFAGQGDAFVAKLTTTGALSYFTYLGGTHADAGTGIAVDPDGNAYVAGTTASVDFPTAGAVFQPTYGGGNTDNFVAKISPDASSMIYSSYLGGTNAELATGIAVDTNRSAYISGQTCSNDFPLANPLQAVPGGNCDAYVSKVSILTGFALNPLGLVFSAQSLNTTSQPQVVTLTNGDNPQTISSIVVIGPNAGDFAETTTCPINSALAVGSTCTITVSFSPSASGIRKASVIITDTVPGSPQVLNLTGNTSTVTLSASSLNFGNQAIGTASAPQHVTVTNSGTTPLSFSSIVASGDFVESDGCTRAPLQPGTNCGIDVIFIPSAAIGSIGAITITDNGAGSPQVILVTGTGIFQAPFQISSLTATTDVSAGKSASYAISVTSPVGFAQPVALSCTAPSTITCSVSPSIVTPSPTVQPAALVTVSTALRTSAPPSPGIRIDPTSLLRTLGTSSLIGLIAVFLVLTAAILRRRPVTAAFGFAVVLLLASVACGGGAAGVPSGTPAGSYQVTISGKSGATTVSIPVTVNVK
jgi:hypothetical protein